MADITRCTEPGCPACGSVITFDDSSSHEHVEKVRLLAAELNQYPVRVMSEDDTITVAPSCWSAENPLRYDYPHTD